jgi:hypothetical protein
MRITKNVKGTIVLALAIIQASLLPIEELCPSFKNASAFYLENQIKGKSANPKPLDYYMSINMFSDNFDIPWNDRGSEVIVSVRRVALTGHEVKESLSNEIESLLAVRGEPLAIQFFSCFIKEITDFNKNLLQKDKDSKGQAMVFLVFEKISRLFTTAIGEDPWTHLADFEFLERMSVYLKFAQSLEAVHTRGVIHGKITPLSFFPFGKDFSKVKIRDFQNGRKAKNHEFWDLQLSDLKSLVNVFEFLEFQIEGSKKNRVVKISVDDADYAHAEASSLGGVNDFDTFKNQKQFASNFHQIVKEFSNHNSQYLLSAEVLVTALQKLIDLRDEPFNFDLATILPNKNSVSLSIPSAEHPSIAKGPVQNLNNLTLLQTDEYLNPKSGKREPTITADELYAPQPQAPHREESERRPVEKEKHETNHSEEPIIQISKEPDIASFKEPNIPSSDDPEILSSEKGKDSHGDREDHQMPNMQSQNDGNEKIAPVDQELEPMKKNIPPVIAFGPDLEEAPNQILEREAIRGQYAQPVLSRFMSYFLVIFLINLILFIVILFFYLQSRNQAKY